MLTTPVQTSAPEVALKLAVLGQLVHRAEVHMASNGSLVLQALVEQRLQGRHKAHRLFVSKVFERHGDEHATYQVVHAKAHHLRAGAEVVVVGHGLVLDQHHGEPVLRLLECASIELTSHLSHFPSKDHHAD